MPRPAHRAGRTPAPAAALVLAQIVSLQAGSAVAKTAYDVVAPTAVAGMRLSFSAVVMVLLVRPRLRRLTPAQWRAAVPLGLVLAAMNAAYFQTISRLPLGVASTVELLGPLALSVALSRRWEHLATAALALTGVLLLTTPGAELPAAGLALGAVAACCRGAYVVLSRRVGGLFPDWSGLAVALAVGACVLGPLTAAAHGRALARHPEALGTGLLVGLLSSLIPYALDMTVLRRIDTRAFGILLALSPAVGAAAGFLLLGEELTTRHLLAMALVAAAGAWSVRRPGPGAPHPGGRGRRTRPADAGPTPTRGKDDGCHDGRADTAQ
ncbi:EamA family transporter [Streptomyces sp. PRKS01-65]|nr:EamA family transporter [Streptomyces harenosi]NEY35253.1 EamA family transporter [Streptomyces harenosi]